VCRDNEDESLPIHADSSPCEQTSGGLKARRAFLLPALNQPKNHGLNDMLL
jgi:hypothetical protein